MSDNEGIVLPHSIEAEHAVLAALMNDPQKDVLARVSDMLQPEDFYRAAHKLIYSAILDLYQKRAQVPGDQVAVANELANIGKLEAVGGRAYIVDVCDSHASAANVEYYAREVHRHSIRRQLFARSREISQLALESEDVDPTLALANNSIIEVSKRAAIAAKNSLSETLKEVVEVIASRFDNPGVQGVPSGFADLDAQTAGFQPGDLTVLAGRTSMGKTQLALNLTYNACKARTPRRVVWFSYEMTREELVERLLSLVSEIPGQNLRTGMLEVEEAWVKLYNAQIALAEQPLEIFDMTMIGRTVAAMGGALRRQIADGKPPDLVIVDHMGFLKGAKQYENRTLEIGEIMTDLKYLLVELGVPGIVLCQLSRKCEERQNKRPMLSDLRESGDIEQTANNVMFLYRDDYYNKESENQGETEIIIAKQRNGPTGTVHLLFRNTVGRFFDLERDRWTKPNLKPGEGKSRYAGSKAPDQSHVINN